MLFLRDVERNTGSVAFGALARIVLVATKNRADPADPPRMIVRAKSNIEIGHGGFGYDIYAAPLWDRSDIIATRIAWHDAIEGTVLQILSEAEGEEAPGGRSKKVIAEAFLKTTLAGGERLQKEIEADAERQGIAARTLRRASDGLVRKDKSGPNGAWMWSLKR